MCHAVRTIAGNLSADGKSYGYIALTEFEAHRREQVLVEYNNTTAQGNPCHDICGWMQRSLWRLWLLGRNIDSGKDGTGLGMTRAFAGITLFLLDIGHCECGCLIQEEAGEIECRPRPRE